MPTNFDDYPSFYLCALARRHSSDNLTKGGTRPGSAVGRRKRRGSYGASFASEVSSPCCDDCQRALSHPHGHDGWHLLKENLHLLRQSADEGCRLCQSLSYGRWYQRSQDPILNGGYTPHCNLVDHSKCRHVCFNTHSSFRGVTFKVGASTYYYLWRYHAGAHDLARALETLNAHASLSLSIGTRKSALHHATHWFAACSEHHECRIDRHNFTPARLLYLQTNDHEPALRLVAREDLVQGVEYTTLSHRWGSGAGPSAKLTSNTAEHYRRGFEETALPRTFRDAVTITRAMGIQYLWIDSLCIVQDSEDDWAQQCGEMALIYGNTACTIAASHAANSEAGLFADEACDESLPIIHKGRSAEAFLCTNGLERWGHIVDDSPLSNRGWVMQERLLSPKTLHFTKKYVAWECAELRATETWSQGITQAAEEDALQGRRPLVHLRRSIDSMGQDRNKIVAECLKLWHYLVQQYCATDLTYQKDRLIAMTGIAKSFRGLLQEHGVDTDYLAGMWSFEMPLGLLWSVTSVGCSRPLDYRAPSWSWASLDMRYYQQPSNWGTNLKGTTNLAEILDAQVAASHDDLYLGVESAFLRIKGGLRKTGIEEYEDNTWYPVGNGHFNVSIHLDIDDEKTKASANLMLPLVALDYTNYCAIDGLALQSTGKRGVFRRFGRIRSTFQLDVARHIRDDLRLDVDLQPGNIPPAFASHAFAALKAYSNQGLPITEADYLERHEHSAGDLPEKYVGMYDQYTIEII